MPDLPHVVFIVLDTARADVFREGAGSPTPTYADLAARGSVYRHAITPAPWTFPSHVSFFSGRMPVEHGMLGDAWPADALPDLAPLIDRLRETWLTSVARDAGYETFAAVANGWVGPRTGFDRGFDTFRTTLHTPGTSRITRATDRIRSRLSPGDDGGPRLVQAFCDWHARRDRGRPFFAFLNLLEPHAPYDPPGYKRRFSGAQRARAIELVEQLRRPGRLMIPYNLHRQELSAADLEILQQLYREEVSVADRALERLLEQLERTGDLERTVIVLTSDHGENVGEHHLLAHNMSLHETLLHVPLVLAGPGVPRAVHEDTVAALRIHPTLLAVLTGHDPGSGLLGGAAQGVWSEYEGALHQVRSLAGAVGDDELAPLARGPGVAAYRGGFKAVATVAGTQLSRPDGGTADATDPDAAGVVSEAESRLSALRDRRETVTAAMDEEIREHLEGLGYL